MKKWLVVGAVAMLVMLIVMWRKVSESQATPKPKAEVSQRDDDAPITREPREKPKKADLPYPVVETPEPTPVAMTDDGKKVVDVASDMIYANFIDVIPKRLWKDAAVCYEGKLGTRQRDAKMKLEFKVVVKGRKATIQDVHVVEKNSDGIPQNTINDPAIESCFFQHIARYGWDTDEDQAEGYALPDYVYEDSLVIRPERSTKYYKSNMEYVGEPAPALPQVKH